MFFFFLNIVILIFELYPLESILYVLINIISFNFFFFFKKKKR